MPVPTSSHTPTFNLKAVLLETGLKPDTLRAWERRYGMPRPERTGGGHRLYSQHDVDALKWLIARQREGMSISRAVELWRRLEAEGQDPLHVATSAMAASTPMPLAGGEAISELRQVWVSACLGFDEQTAEHTLAHAFALYPAETVCFEVLQKGLSHIGEAWYQGQVTVQQEHFASALAMRRLDALLAAAPPPTQAGRILVVCPPEERHTFAPLLLTFLLRRRGWEVIYLGANVPVDRLETALSSVKPDLVILTAQLLHTAATLLSMAQVLQREHVPSAFGGRVFNLLPALRARIPGQFLGERLETAPQVVEQLMTTPQPPPHPVETPSAAYRQALDHYLERQSLIEAQVRKVMQHANVPHAHLSIANLNMAHNIAAALELGDTEFLGKNIAWVEGLLRNNDISTDVLRRYLSAYYQASKAHLDGRGKPIVDWLARLTREGETG